jgi:RimJ/RimL family protein N-acetyltransferase
MSFETHRTLFNVGGIRAVELQHADVPQLQRFFEANPGYFVSVSGEPPGKDEAQEELLSEIPTDWPFTKKWAIGFVDATGSLTAMATVISDMLAPGVWNVGFFILETREHGQGVAQGLYEGLQTWTCGLGAQWLRLGVVAGNARAERFWERVGFIEVRRRNDVPMKSAVVTMRVMVKAVGSMGLAEYLARVGRDRSDATVG